MKQVPKSWSEVTLKQYYELIEVTAVTHLTDEDKAVAMVSAISGLEIEYLMDKVDIKDLAKAINQIKFIGEDKATGNVKPVLRVNGRKFLFDLVLRNSNASSFISFSEQIKDPKEAKKNIHNVLAIFCYELNWWGGKKKRTASSQKEIAEWFKENLNMNDAFLYRDFFLLSYKTLLASTKNYLDLEQNKIMKKLKKMSQSDL